MKKVVTLFAATALFLGAVFTSCEKETIPEYTVSFDSKGGTPTPQSQTVKQDGKVQKPSDPTRENHNFVGWAKADNESSALWNFEAETVTMDIMLFARWAINTYLVTFDSDGGTSVGNQSIPHGGTVTKPADPTHAGYEFNGWFAGDTEWNFNTVITAPITLKAKWTRVHTLTFDSDGGTEVSSQTIRDGNKAIRPTDPTKAWTPQSGLYRGTPPTSGNYTFDGWYNGETLWNFDNVITENITLKAKWQGDFNLIRIESVLSNDVAAAVAYVNANSNSGEEYTLLIGATNVTSGAQTLNAANAKLTIMGIGTERIIKSTPTSSYGRLFTINGNNSTSLTLGQNITLKSGGGSGLVTQLINIQRGNLTMREGSKISEDPAGAGRVNSSGAILVSGINSNFKMEGGEISGMYFSTNTCAVKVSGGGLFEMSGGSITDNTNSHYGLCDINIDYNCTFRLSGNARIGALILYANNATTRTSVNIVGNYSGTVNRLHLGADIVSNTSNIPIWWTNAPVIVNGTASVISTFNNGLGNFFSSWGLSASINATHILNAQGLLVLKEN